MNDEAKLKQQDGSLVISTRNIIPFKRKAGKGDIDKFLKRRDRLIAAAKEPDKKEKKK